MSRPRVPKAEIVPRGEDIYEQDIRPKLGPEHEGKFVVLDVTTGEYAMADDDLEASELVLEKTPRRSSTGSAWSRCSAAPHLQDRRRRSRTTFLAVRRRSISASPGISELYWILAKGN